MDSFFISSRPLLKFIEQLLREFTRYLQRLSGEVSYDGWSLLCTEHRSGAHGWNVAEEHAPPFLICRCSIDVSVLLALLQAQIPSPVLRDVTYQSRQLGDAWNALPAMHCALLPAARHLFSQLLQVSAKHRGMAVAFKSESASYVRLDNGCEDGSKKKRAAGMR